MYLDSVSHDCDEVFEISLLQESSTFGCLSMCSFVENTKIGVDGGGRDSGSENYM